MTPDPLKFLPQEGRTMVQAGRHLAMPRNHVCILLCGYVVKKVERHRFDSWRFYPLGLWFFCLELLPKHQEPEESLLLKAGGGGSSPRLISRQGGQGGSEGWSTLGWKGVSKRNWGDARSSVQNEWTQLCALAWHLGNVFLVLNEDWKILLLWCECPLQHSYWGLTGMQRHQEVISYDRE